MDHSHFDELISLRLGKNIPHFTEYLSPSKCQQQSATSHCIHPHESALHQSHFFFKKYFLIIHQLCPDPSSSTFPSGFSGRSISSFISPPTRATCPAHPYTPWFHNLIFLEKYKQISNLPITSHSWMLNICLFSKNSDLDFPIDSWPFSILWYPKMGHDRYLPLTLRIRVIIMSINHRPFIESDFSKSCSKETSSGLLKISKMDTPTV